jgi:alpha-L-fucosidase
MIEEGLVAKSIDGGFSLKPQNQFDDSESSVINKKEWEGTIPEHVVVKRNQSFRWKIYVNEPGEKWVDVSYSFQQITTNSKISIKAANNELIHRVLNTGKTVGEPNQNWIIDNFKSNRCGKINFPEKGLYTVDILINTENNEEVKFQWLWIK